MATSDLSLIQRYDTEELAERFAQGSSRMQSTSYRIAKRCFDLAICFLLLPFVGVMLLLLALFVLCSSGMPIFYKQERIGQNGKTFTLYKFRTMRQGGAQILAQWLERNPEAAEEWYANHKLKYDPRITRGGRFLRETSLDELPQILNIFKGEMSFVGPRPVVHAELAKYGERVGYYLAATPGLTGLWQVSGRCNVSYEQRVRMDERYVVEWTFWRDLHILLRTPLSVFRRDGAC